MNLKELSRTIRRLEIQTNRQINALFSGNYKSSFKGQGLEVSDLREYDESDDARYIDWITTAKQGSPYVKKFQETRELTTLILVDVSASMKFTTADKTKNRTAIEAAAYLLFSSLKNNDRFGAIIFSDKIESYIPPKKGKVHLLRVLREILFLSSKNKNNKGNLKEALSFLQKAVKKRSICFLISDSIADIAEGNKKDIALFQLANRRHDFVYIKIYDQFEMEIVDKMPALNLINPETNESEIIDLSDNKTVDNYNRIRNLAEDSEKMFVRKSKVDRLLISTSDNIYNKLLLFFKKRNLRY